MPKILPKPVLSLLCLCLIPVAEAQQSEPLPVSQNARALIQTALDQQKVAAAAKTRYTNLRLVHEQNFNEKGKKTSDWLRLFEDTWINNLPYERLLAKDGRPLKGKDLRLEQSLFDDAIHARHPLGNQERILLDGAHPVSTGTSPSDALTPGYTVREVQQEDSPNGRVHVIEATRIPGKLSHCSWRYRFWIADVSGTLFHSRADVVNDKPGSDPCGDSSEESSWELVDGAPKIVHNRAHFYVSSSGSWTTIDSEITFTQYRRFRATVTITPTSGASPE